MPKNKNKMKYNYKTTDFYLTAYLLAKSYKLEDLETNISGKYVFVISSNGILTNEINSFYAGNSTVNPLDYQNQIRNLKSLIHAIN